MTSRGRGRPPTPPEHPAPIRRPRRPSPGGSAATRPEPDWAGAGITLNAVAPGAVETPLLQQSRDDPVLGRFVDAFPIPIGRKGTADELAAFVAFLLGPDARFFCGSVLFVDGGTDAQLRPDDHPQLWG